MLRNLTDITTNHIKRTKFNQVPVIGVIFQFTIENGEKADDYDIVLKLFKSMKSHWTSISQRSFVQIFQH